MKQISARAFREVFRTLDEPVTVSTRGEGGYVKIIGTWTPAGNIEREIAMAEYQYTRLSDNHQTGATLEPLLRPFTPVPKPIKRR